MVEEGALAPDPARSAVLFLGLVTGVTALLDQRAGCVG
jgi:hypothetical protein